MTKTPQTAPDTALPSTEEIYALLMQQVARICPEIAVKQAG